METTLHGSPLLCLSFTFLIISLRCFGHRSVVKKNSSSGSQLSLFRNLNNSAACLRRFTITQTFSSFCISCAMFRSEICRSTIHSTCVLFSFSYIIGYSGTISVGIQDTPCIYLNSGCVAVEKIIVQ